MRIACPECGCDSKVIETATDLDGNETCRKRQCVKCKKRFMTSEKVAEYQTHARSMLTYLRVKARKSRDL